MNLPEVSPDTPSIAELRAAIDRLNAATAPAWGTIWDEVLQTCSPDSSCGPGFVWSNVVMGCVYEYPSDANLDGCVDVQDFMEHLSQFGQGCSD